MQDFLKELFNWICQQSHNAPWFLFFLLMLSGLSIPLSEDLIVIIGGVIAARCMDAEHFPKFLFFMLWLGCLLSAWEAYWIGRLLGPKLFKLPIIHTFIKPKHIESADNLLKKFGIYSFFIGRFCPGGIRNALFLTSGLTKMPFPVFIRRDFFAGTLTTIILFSIGYLFGQNLDQIVEDVGYIEKIAILIAASIVAFFFIFRKLRK